MFYPIEDVQFCLQMLLDHLRQLIRNLENRQMQVEGNLNPEETEKAVQNNLRTLKEQYKHGEKVLHILNQTPQNAETLIDEDYYLRSQLLSMLEQLQSPPEGTSTD
jgi:hypothetical protein